MSLLLVLFLLVPFPRSPQLELYQIPREGKKVILLSFQVPNSQLVFKKMDNEFFAEVELRVKVKKKKDLIFSDYWRFSNSVRRYELSKSDEDGISRTVSFQLYDSGKIRIEAELFDLVAGRNVLEFDTAFTLYRESVSDLIPISLTAIRAGDKKLIPQFLRDVDTLLVYLAFDTAFCRNMVNWKLEKLGRHTKGSVVRSGTKHLRVNSGWDTLMLDLGGLPNGEYLLTLKIGKLERKLHFNKYSFTDLSDEEYEDLVSALVYIAEPKELEKLKKAKGEERKRLWDDFWAKRDPTPGTPENELKDEYLRRVEYANEHFSIGRWPGYKTDRGRIYILLGPPDEIEDHPFDVDAYPYQIWYYHSKRLALLFIDQSGAGDYVLVNPPYDFDFEF